MNFTHGTFSEAGRFGIVGIINTIIDFTIFNILTSKPLNVHKVQANICSTSVAMIFSFFANREAVFTGGTGNPWIQAVMFFLVTAFGLYVIQTGVLYLLAERWQWFKRIIIKALSVTQLSKRISLDFALKNSSKIVGTLCSLIWNFFMYKYLVFQ